MSPIRIPDPAEICLTIVMTVFVTHTVGVNAEEYVSQNIGAKPHICQSEVDGASLFVDPKAEASVKFNLLASQWKAERGARGSAAAMAALPSYQKILGMGPAALPPLLAQLKAEGDEPDHWFWALAFIAEENPVPVKSRGRLKEMASAWIKWGEEKGYV